MIRCPRRSNLPDDDGRLKHTLVCKSTDLEVTSRLCGYSAFNGYHYTPSDYSGVRCRTCGHLWRTKASVHHLPDRP